MANRNFLPKAFPFQFFSRQNNKGFWVLVLQFVHPLKKKLTRGYILETKSKVWKAYAFGEKSNHCKKILAKFASVNEASKNSNVCNLQVFLHQIWSWYWTNSFLFLLRHQKWEYFLRHFFPFHLMARRLNLILITKCVSGFRWGSFFLVKC